MGPVIVPEFEKSSTISIRGSIDPRLAFGRLGLMSGEREVSLGVVRTKKVKNDIQFFKDNSFLVFRAECRVCDEI